MSNFGAGSRWPVWRCCCLNGGTITSGRCSGCSLSHLFVVNFVAHFVDLEGNASSLPSRVAQHLRLSSQEFFPTLSLTLSSTLSSRLAGLRSVASEVAQVSNLLYRRFPIGRAWIAGGCSTTWK